MKEHQTKYRLICEAATHHITKYNKAFNQTVIDHCNREPKFKPKMACLTREDGKKCKFLKIKEYQ